MGASFIGGSTLAATHYVWQDSPNPAPPYNDWATAAHVIQDAVDLAVAEDEVVVTNGIYATGGRAVYGMMTNRVAVDKPLTLRSVNGPQFTVVQGFQVPASTNGDGAIRCVYLTNGASLSGFTLAHGATRTNGDWFFERSGGGFLGESASAVITNCVLESNSADLWGGAVFMGSAADCALIRNSAGVLGGGASKAALARCRVASNFSGAFGGGVDGCTLDNCTLTNNQCPRDGGGARSSTLKDSTVVDNSAGRDGGGVYGGTIDNCTFTHNAAGVRGGGAFGARLDNCRLLGNMAENGGGAGSSSLSNCVVAFNSAGTGGGGRGSHFDEMHTDGQLSNECGWRCRTRRAGSGQAEHSNAFNVG